MSEATKAAAKTVAPVLTASTIYDASKGEIIAFALETAGLAFTGDESREYLIAQVSDALDWAHRDPSDGATHVVLKIAKTSEEGGSLDVRGGFNGNMFTLQREVEVEVPIGYYNVLMDANSVGFTIAPMTKAKNNAPDEDIIPKTKYPLQVIRFLKKA